MENSVFQVRMFGAFSIRKGDQEINDSDNRSRKIWLLLAYMIYCRTRTISQSELLNLLWSDEEGSSNPPNALKTMFHRARASLNQLDATAGHRLIIRRNGNYAWNTDIPFFYDVDEFEKQYDNIEINNRELSLLNNAILSHNFNRAIRIADMYSFLYNNHFIKSIYRKYNNRKRNNG